MTTTITTTTNEAAERLHDAVGHFRNRGVRIQMIREALAAERRATVERIRSQVQDRRILRLDEQKRAQYRHILDILDEEAAR